MSNAASPRQNSAASDERLLGRIIAAGSVTLAAALVVFLVIRLVILPMTVVRNVTVESDVGLSQAEIQKLMGLRGTESFFTLETSLIQKRLEAHVLVRRARVEKLFPDSLHIFLYSREVSALVLAESGGRIVPVLVDRDGLAFKIGGTAAEVDVPVVSGLAAGEAVLGARLPAAYTQVFADLAALRAKSPSLYKLISEVRIVSRDGGGSDQPAAVAAEGGASASPASTSSAAGVHDGISAAGVHDGISAAGVNPELRLFLVSSPVPVRVRGTIDETLVKYALMVLDLLSSQGVLGDIGELDFRGGDVVYRMKEG
jgi:cell division protein FtsQ